MNLFYYEIQKLFLNKKIILIILGCLLISLCSSAMTVINLKNRSGDYVKLRQEIQTHEGKIDPILASKASSEVNRLQALRINNPDEFEKEHQWYVIFQYMYANTAVMVKSYNEGSDDESLENPYSIQKMKLYLESNSNKKDSFAYRNVYKNLQMKETVGEPGFYNIRIWDEMFSFLDSGGAIFMTLLLAIVIAPIFSGEVASGMDSLILSSKLGRSKIVTAKLLAAGTFTTLWVLCFYILNLIVYFAPFGGLDGFDKPLNSIYTYHVSPYGGWSILTYFFVSMGFTWLACMTLSIITTFFSITYRTSLGVFGTALAILLLPEFISKSTLGTVFWPIVDLGLMRVAQVIQIFIYYKAYNFFGNPILYPVVVATLLIMFSGFMVWLCYSVYKRRNAVI